MATIREIVNKIRTAIYGKDVREAIASGIEKCYEDASTNRMTISDGAVSTEKLADGAVTNDKIATGTITASKIQDGEVVKMVKYGNTVVTDNNQRVSYPDISTIVKTDLIDGASANDDYPITGGAIKRYLRSSAIGSMSEAYGGRARISLNGVTNYVPTMPTAEPSGKIDYRVMPLATSETSGAMSAADKTKLDSVNLEDLENISSVSIELGETSGPGSYYAVLTIDGESYRLPLLNPAQKMLSGNLPLETDISSTLRTSNPATVQAIKDYANGSASGEPGARKLILNIGGTAYEVPIILSTGKIGSPFVPVTDTVTQQGILPVNGKAVYDYIEGLDIGDPTDAQVNTAVTNWMEENISSYVSHGIDWDTAAGYIELHTYPEDPEMDTILYAPLLETTSSKINSRYIPIDNTLTQEGLPADAKKTGDEISDLKSALNELNQAHTNTTGGIAVVAFLGSSKWAYNASGSKTIIFPVNDGDEIVIKSNATNNGYIGFLTDLPMVDCVGDTPSYSVLTGFTGRITHVANRTYSYNIPTSNNDIKYIAISVVINGNDATPISATINGNNILTDVIKYIDSVIGAETINKNIGAWTSGKRIANYKMTDVSGYEVATINAKKGDVIVVSATNESSTLNLSAISKLLPNSDIYVPLVSNGVKSQEYIVKDDEVLHLCRATSHAYGMTISWIRYVGSKEYNSETTNEEFDFSKNEIRTELTALCAYPQALPNYPSNVAQKPLVLAHYSDVHLDVARAYNVSRFAEIYSEIDDIVFTGDCAGSYFSDYNQFYDFGILRKTLIAIGNHDVYADAQGSSLVTPSQKYSAYMNHVSEWGVTQPQNAESNGLCYYYKDYDVSDGAYESACTVTTVRLVVLDAMAYDNAQHLWLQSVLADAQSGGIPVLIAEHFPPTITTNDTDKFNTGFCSLSSGMEAPYGRSMLSYDNNAEHSATVLVDSFIDNGGEFICWLCGHLHYGMVGTLKSHPRQIYIAVEGAKATSQTWSDTPRDISNESQNLFNVVSIDTYNKVIKVLRIGASYDNRMRKKRTMTIDYANRVLLASE